MIKSTSFKFYLNRITVFEETAYGAYSLPYLGHVLDKRINRELKRRSKVIVVFPNDASLLRLMGCVLIEHNDRSLNARKIFSDETYKKLISSNVPSELRRIAGEQRNLLAARS